MKLDPQRLISGNLDDTLTAQEHAALSEWLKLSPKNAHDFAEAMLLHDRLRNEQLALASMTEAARLSPPMPAASPRRQVRKLASAVSILLVTVAVIAMVWIGFTGTPAAAAVELKRLIAASIEPADRTYKITVEEPTLPARLGKGEAATDGSRPPKPPMHGAMLYLRGQQFVLVRKTADGLPFITGSNGQTSWAVRPAGPVRVSSDLLRFSRDLPGHESSLPLVDMKDGLERLRAAYDIEVLPVEMSDDAAQASDEPSRLMVAVKKRGFRGPRRVEITYSAKSGLIKQMRFIEMPYGPERLTLTLTLVEQRPLGVVFFDHQSHHDASRTVELEE